MGIKTYQEKNTKPMEKELAQSDLNLKISQKWLLFLLPTIYDHMKMPEKVEKLKRSPPYEGPAARSRVP